MSERERGREGEMERGRSGRGIERGERWRQEWEIQKWNGRGRWRWRGTEGMKGGERVRGRGEVRMVGVW